MDVMIKNGKIEIPKEILKKAHISEEGKCEMDIVENEIRIKNKKQEEY